MKPRQLPQTFLKHLITSHKQLVCKLSSFEYILFLLPGLIFSLPEKSIQVSVDGISSNEYLLMLLTLTTSVTEGPCLAPFLFHIFVNGILSITFLPI